MKDSPTGSCGHGFGRFVGLDGHRDQEDAG
jgi:hypothetical protein